MCQLYHIIFKKMSNELRQVWQQVHANKMSQPQLHMPHAIETCLLGLMALNQVHIAAVIENIHIDA